MKMTADLVGPREEGLPREASLEKTDLNPVFATTAGCVAGGQVSAASRCFG